MALSGPRQHISLKGSGRLGNLWRYTPPSDFGTLLTYAIACNLADQFRTTCVSPVLVLPQALVVAGRSVSESRLQIPLVTALSISSATSLEKPMCIRSHPTQSSELLAVT